MNIKLAEIRNRHQALCMLGNKKLPIKLAYAIGKNIMKLQEELDSIEKARVKLVEQYAQKEEDGTFTIKDGHYELGENEEKLNEEFREFLNTETDITIHTVLDEIVECMDNERYDALSPAELIAIDFMLEHHVSEEVETEA